MASNGSGAVLGRALLFSAIYSVSLVAFPLAAFLSAYLPIGRSSNLLFFWPQFVLYPNGFTSVGVTDTQRFFTDTAIYGAIIFWLAVAVVFGLIFRDLTKKLAAVVAIPYMIVIAFVVNYGLMLVGYAAALDGP